MKRLIEELRLMASELGFESLSNQWLVDDHSLGERNYSLTLKSSRHMHTRRI